MKNYYRVMLGKGSSYAAECFAGGFIDVLLFGMIPALVILHNRKKYHAKGRYQLTGGRITPILIILVCLAILLIKHYTPASA